MPFPMQPPIYPPYMRRSLLVNNHKLIKMPPNHKERIRQTLRRLGVSKWGMVSMEAHYVPHIIHPKEEIGGVVYGFCESSFVMLLATDRRIVYLDKKPLFVKEDEINYYAVTGVSYSSAGFGSTVTLHTRIRDFVILTFNERCAQGFVAYIESRCLESLNKDGGSYDRRTQEWDIQTDRIRRG